MTDTLYPSSSRELAEIRRALAPETEKLSRPSAAKCLLTVRCRPSTRDAAPVLHRGAYQGRTPSRRHASGTDGGDLGVAGM